MPAMHFSVRWPDALETRCYSPSLVIKDHFTPHTRYALPVFLDEVRTALHVASERVRAKYGFACSMALDQLAEIERVASHYDAKAEVEMLDFEE